MDIHSQLLTAAISDMGAVRTNNEDACYVQPIWDDSALLAIVADGLGGYEGGEVASQTAIDTIVAYLNNYKTGVRAELLRQAVIEANNAIIMAQRANAQLHQMGSVITVMLVEPQQHCCHMAHVGDTRLYQYDDTLGLVKLSHDHTMVGYKEEQGELTEREAINHPQRNVVAKVLGSSRVSADDHEFVETATFTLRPSAIYLLCSDGLFDMIYSTDISRILRAPGSIESKAAQLIDEAKAAGGKDNVTVVLVHNTEPDPQHDAVAITTSSDTTLPNENEKEGDTDEETVATENDCNSTNLPEEKESTDAGKSEKKKKKKAPSMFRDAEEDNIQQKQKKKRNLLRRVLILLCISFFAGMLAMWGISYWIPNSDAQKIACLSDSIDSLKKECDSLKQICDSLKPVITPDDETSPNDTIPPKASAPEDAQN